MLALLRVWYSDDNAIVRDKPRRRVMTHLAPALSVIIAQGNVEGTFSAGSPDSARVIVTLLQVAQELAIDLFFARQANAIPFDAVESSFGAHAEAFERILGIAPGSVTLIDGPPLRVWYG